MILASMKKRNNIETPGSYRF